MNENVILAFLMTALAGFSTGIGSAIAFFSFCHRAPFSGQETLDAFL
jgi:F0F1-type ATP synthase membrane subunit c/vacuolar-type H+-ATPase subunit K